jgi:hypothetical protein
LSVSDENSILKIAGSTLICSVSSPFSIISMPAICIFEYYAEKFNKAVFNYNIPAVGCNWNNDPFPDGDGITVW